MNRFISTIFFFLILCAPVGPLLAHAEHDKARYVATDGVDTGRCGKATTPCKTIRYAAQHANKGDNIRVAAGNYPIDDTDTLFYLLSEILPITGNFSQSDQYQKRNEKHITQLTGVPLEYATILSKKGFTVIVDQKGQNTETMKLLHQKLDVFSRLQKSQSKVDCSGGKAGDFSCNNIDLLSHMPLSSFSTNPSDANDIWGHFDLNDNKEYALIGLSNGIGIVDVSQPEDPQVITTIASQSTIWRDLKVYQFYDTTEKRWKSYAYVTADNASVGLMIIDLTNLPQSASVASTDTTDTSAHNVYLSNVDYSTGVPLTGRSPYLHIAGSNRNGGAFNSYSLANPTSISNVYKPVDATRSNYSHDVASMVITDPRKDSQCVNGTDHCEVFFDFNENDFQLWDKTTNDDPQRLSTTSYANANYVHSGWFTEDKLVVIVHDELDEINAGLNTTVRFFDMSDLTAPVQVGTWTGPTRSIDHNGFVRGNRYYMSNYERGLTVLDITNPSRPLEVGYFDTYPVNNSASFNGAWGVYPFLPSGNLLVSDINSGLYVLGDRTLTSINGSFQFDASSYPVNEGESVTITINRNNGSMGGVEVAWELATGAADQSDFNLNSGTLNWLDGDDQAKTITVTTSNDALTESAETFFIRLFNPQNGATLTSPSLAMITINAENSAPSVSAGEDSQAEIGANINLIGTADDPDGDALTYLWSQTSGETVTITDANTPNARFNATSSGSFVFLFTATDPLNNSSSDSVTVTITSTNAAPVVSANVTTTGNTGEVILLTATATDSDADSMTFSWDQTAGTSINLTNTDQLETSFIPFEVGSYSFEFTATDSAGNSAVATVSLNVVAPEPSPEGNDTVESGGGGSFNLLFLLLTIGGMYSRRK